MAVDTIVNQALGYSTEDASCSINSNHQMASSNIVAANESLAAIPGDQHDGNTEISWTIQVSQAVQVEPLSSSESLPLSNGAENQHRQTNGGSAVAAEVIDNANNTKSTISYNTTMSAQKSVSGGGAELPSSSYNSAGTTNSSSRKKKPLSVSTGASPNNNTRSAGGGSLQPTPSPLSMSSPKFDKVRSTKAKKSMSNLCNQSPTSS